MIKKLNLMLPTYGRAKTRLPMFIRTALENCEDSKNICFTFVVNKKDTETVACIEEECGSNAEYCIIYEELEKPNLSKYFNMAYEQTKFKDFEIAASMLGDDMEFVTHGYDVEIMKWMNMFGGLGIFFCDDAKGTGDSLCVNFFTSRSYVEGLKPLPFMCELFPCDDMDVVHYLVAKELGLLFYLDHVKIFHNHATLAGRMDDVWLRLRTTFPEVEKNKSKEIYHGRVWGNREYEAKCVENLRKNLELDDRRIGVFMTTKDRVELLEDTVESYTQANDFPSYINVFDDCSLNLSKVTTTVSKMKGAIMHFNSLNLGCDKNNVNSIRWMVENTKYEVFIILDSDCLLHRYWYQRAKTIADDIKRDPKIGCASLFNAGVMRKVDERFLVEKDFIGGLSMIFSRNFATKYILKNPDLKPWDTNACVAAVKDGKKIYASSPSFVQHLGYAEGTHCGGVIASTARDALPIAVASRKYSLGVGESKEVLFGVMARYGDIIIGSFLVKMLQAKGYRVTWYVAYVYEDLVRLLCPGVRIICGGVSRDAKWVFTSTKLMRDTFPGYGFYINAQPGSPEHHDRLMKSGRHMAWFMKDIVETAIGESLPEDFATYIPVVKYPPATVSRDNDKPLAIIAPEVISIPTAIPKEKMEELYTKYSKDYEVKILVEKMPAVTPNERNHKYIYGYSFLQCFDVLSKAKLFIGNDSALAWVSMFNKECRKIIFHHKYRMLQTNVRYHDIDPLAEDVIL